MANRRNGIVKKYHQISSLGGPLTATNTGYVQQLLDIKSTIEALASSGEEVQIRRALFHLRTRSTSANSAYTISQVELAMIRLVFAVSDTVFTNGAGGSGIVDRALDARNAGDFEAQVLCTKVTEWRPVGWESGTPSFRLSAMANIAVDVTNHVRRAAETLARSAILGTNPEFSILGIFVGTQDHYWQAALELDYVIVPRRLRML